MIAGPTSVGKTGLSIRLAKRIGGEIISADSRQVYRGLNIGTGKVTTAEMKGVPHHLLDVADPKTVFNASDFVRLGRIAIADIRRRGRVPIIVGGTGFYIDALLGRMHLAEVPPNKKLRKGLSKKSLAWLQARLKKLDPKRSKTIDTKNSVRLIRAIEIATALGKVPSAKPKELYTTLYIGLAVPLPKLKKKIHMRLFARIREGMLAEARRLHKAGMSWKRMEELGLEYRYMARHLQGKMTRKEMTALLESEIFKYAKRQMTWFKKTKDIKWFTPPAPMGLFKTTQNFLK